MKKENGKVRSSDGLDGFATFSLLSRLLRFFYPANGFRVS